jgi:hypothetical protein
MTISKQTALALHEREIEVEAERAYIKTHDCDCCGWQLSDFITTSLRKHDLRVPRESMIPAPNTDELLAVLPHEIHRGVPLVIVKYENGYSVGYNDNIFNLQEENESLPEALAQLLIALHEDESIKE